MSDNLLLYSSIGLCCILLWAVCYRNKRFGVVNIVVFFCYNLGLHWMLFKHGDYGSSFLWWFILLIVTFIHVIIMSIYLIINRLKENNQ